MDLKKIFKKVKIIYEGFKLWMEFTFRVFLVMILMKLGVVLHLFDNIDYYVMFAIITSLLFFTIRPIISALEYKMLRRRSE